MNFFCDSGGNIFHVDSEKVYQGSVNANKIYFIGAFPSNCEVLVRYTLPNGIYSEQELCTKTTDTRLLEMHDKNGQEYNVWEVSLHKIVTQYFGTVAVQFSVVGSNGLLATALSSFEILRGVPVVIDTEDKDTLATQILQLVSELDIDTIRNMLETYQAKVEDLAKNLDTTQYIKKDEFNDEVIESLTNNERNLTFTEKYNACEWLGAVSNNTPCYYYDECSGAIATMFNSKGKNERPTHVLLWEQESSSDVMGSERIIKLPNEDGRLLTEEKAKQEYVEKKATTDTFGAAYITFADGTQGTIPVANNSGSIKDGAVARYSPSGRIYVNDPLDNDYGAAASAGWCRNKFIEKTTVAPQGYFVYGTDYQKTTTKMINAFHSTTENGALAMYGPNGILRAKMVADGADGDSDLNIVNKGGLRAALANAGGKLYRHRMTIEFSKGDYINENIEVYTISHTIISSKDTRLSNSDVVADVATIGYQPLGIMLSSYSVGGRYIVAYLLGLEQTGTDKYGLRYFEIGQLNAPNVVADLDIYVGNYSITEI